MPARKSFGKRTSDTITFKAMGYDLDAMAKLTSAYYHLNGRRRNPTRTEIIRWALQYAESMGIMFRNWLAEQLHSDENFGRERRGAKPAARRSKNRKPDESGPQPGIVGADICQHDS